MKIGERIKQRRLELGYTADALAKMLNKNRATIYRYENGDIENMPIDVLEPLAKALNTTPAYLMGWDESSSARQNTKFSPRIERDIQKRIQSILDDLNSDAGLAFYNGGEEMDDETKDLLKLSLETSIRTAKRLSQEKFTPKKYRKNDTNP